MITDGIGQDVGAWWVLGDLVAIGPEPVATLELVADLPSVRVTRGNTERYVLSRDRPPPYQAALAGARADIVCAGHTHRPTDRRVDGIRAVNLGTLSNPITGTSGRAP